MAHEIDETTGRAAMAYVGQKPWHGLGNELDPNAGIDEWRESAGANWTANRSWVCWNDGDEHRWPDQHVLYRSDTKAPLAIVSKGYQVVQPAEVFEFFRAITEGIGGFTMNTAGCLRGGKRIWALAKADKRFRLADDDKLDRYLLLATSYDKSLATTVRQVTTRVVCANTLQVALGESRDCVVQNHLKKFRPELIRQQMSLDEGWATFKAACHKLVGLRMNRREAREIFVALFATEAYRATPFYSIAAENRMLDRVMNVYREAVGQDTETAKGTAWGVLNAVTRYVDHEVRARSQENRLINAWWGAGANVKRRAFTTLASLAG